MTREAVRRTVRVYYQEGAYESFKCHFRLEGLGEERKEIQDLDSEFDVGPHPASKGASEEE